jgi:ABC-type transporter lipoprotein component MlaA
MNHTMKKLATPLVALLLLPFQGMAGASGAVERAPVLVKHTESIDIYEARDRYIVKVLDPYADFNRVISDFNADVYDIFKTPASLYSSSPWMIPIRWPLKMASSVMSNVGELTVGTTANIITGEFAQAGQSVARALTNFVTTGGTYDMATTLSQEPIADHRVRAAMGPLETLENSMRSNISELQRPTIKNFDDAFRRWGFGCGVYLVFPLLGPGTSRELAGRVAEIPLQPETYVQPVVLVRIAGTIHDTLMSAERAKPLLQGYDLSTAEGKEQFYTILRTAILSSNHCLDDKIIKQDAAKQGITVTDEFE